MACPLVALGQQEGDSTSTTPVTLPSTVRTSLDSTQAGNAAGQPSEISIQPLLQRVPQGFERATSDSLLRWQLWSSLTEMHHRRAGVISHRLGGLSRNNGFIDGADLPTDQVYMLDDVPLNDPVTGRINLFEVPQHRLANMWRRPGGLQSRYQLESLDYYVSEPITMIDFEQTEFDYRNLDGRLTRNVGKKINIQAGYWSRNENGGYANSATNSRQAFGRVMYHLDKRRMLRVNVLYNGIQNDEPLGYQISSLATFGFQRLNTSAVSSTAESSVRKTMY